VAAADAPATQTAPPAFFGEETAPAGAPEAPAETPAFFNGVADLPPPPPEPKKPEERGAVSQFIHDTVLDPGKTGFEKARQVGAILASPARSKEATAESIANAQQAMPEEPAFRKQADTDVENSKGFFGALGAYLSNPKALAADITQSLVSGGGVLAASAGAGAAGGPVGAAAGAGAAGYLDTYGQTVLDTFAQHGVDLADKAAVLKALNDPALMSVAAVAAHKAGVPSAVINAISFGLAGRVGGPAASKIASPVLRRVAGAGAEAGAQAAIGAGGEAGTEELNTGAVDPRRVVGAGVQQAAMTAPFAAFHAGAGPADSLGGVDRATAPAAPTVADKVHNVMELGQQHAAEIVKEAGGDNLSQVVAATNVNAELGAHHDAVATDAARKAELAAHQAKAEQQARDEAFQQMEAEQGENPAQQALAKENAFQQADADQAAQKEQDFGAAKNQVGEEEVEGAQTAEAGAEKGGANEAPATIADTLSPDQRSVLERIKAERAAAPEPTVKERMQAQNPEDNFRELPPETEAEAPQEAPEPAEKAPPPEVAPEEPKAPEAAPEAEEEPESENPPPAALQSLAERRQAAFDKALAEKTRGATEKPPEQAPAEEPPEQAPVEAAPAEPPPNRLAAIRQAVEKVQGAKPAVPEKGTLATRRAKQVSPEPEALPERGPEKQYVARNADTGEEVARFDKYEDAKAHKEQFPNDDITHEEPKQPAAKNQGEPENDWFNDNQRGIAEDMDRALNPRMSHDEAKEHLSAVSDHFGPRNFRVDASARENTASPALAGQISEWGKQHPNGRLYGVYDPGTSIAHVFADSHNAGDHEELRNTAVHELTHKGINGLLGKQYGPTMDAVYNSIKDTAWARKLVERRGMDLRTVDNRRLLAEEYAAHLSENIMAGKEVHEDLPVPDKDPGLKQRFLNAVRAVLRALGISRHWNDNDIARLVKQAHQGLGDPTDQLAREGAEYKGPRFSADEGDDEVDRDLAPDHPLAVGHKLGRTMEEMARYSPGFIRGAADSVKEAWDRTLSARLATIGLRNLPDFLNQRTRPVMPSVRAFIRTHDAMDGRRGRLAEEGGKIYMDWAKWATDNKRMGDKLADVMHASTISGADPTKPYAPKHDAAEIAADPSLAPVQAAHKSAYDLVKDAYNGLDDKGKEIYNKVRDFHQDRRADVLRGLEARIDESGASNKDKQQLMTTLRKTFEAGRVAGPYFPLVRFGDHFARAFNDKGETVAFSRFESKAQRKAWVQNAEAQGFKTETGVRLNTDKSLMERINPDFVKKITALAKDVDPNLADEIWQEYLKGMPEMSMRKSFIHRQGRLGYSADALRGFGYQAFHGSHQIARLEYGNRLDAHMDDMERQAQAAQTNPDLTDADKHYAAQLHEEMGRRLAWIKNPKAGPVASTITKLGFGWYLGFAPATAFRISTQNMMLAHPILAKYHGSIGATRELTKASAQWLQHGGSQNFMDSLRGDERDAMETAKDRGVFSSTWAQTLASGGEGKPQTGPAAAYLKASSYLFNAMEYRNRMSTFLAAYRLGRMGAMTHAQAVEHAGDVSWDSHFDYSNANRPRFMQNDFVKVAGLFKQYSLGVTYRLAREFRNSTRIDGGVSPEERMQAVHALGSLLGRSFMFAGATGLPLAWLGWWAASKALSSQDNPVDAKALAHSQLADQYGQHVADAVMTGPAGAISGASLSRGASYSDLWYKPPEGDPKAMDVTTDMLMQLGGAAAAVPINMVRGGAQIAQGHTERGLEHFLPPSLAGPAKAARYANEGVQTLRGEPVMRKEDMATGDLFRQAIGFTPQDVADQYELNNQRQTKVDLLNDRRKDLKGSLVAAIVNGARPEDIEEAQKDIDKFNEANPDYAIRGDEARTIAFQARQAATAVNGINLPAGIRERLLKEIH
jgi:Large polyvalent protein associated domain 39